MSKPWTVIAIHHKGVIREMKIDEEDMHLLQGYQPFMRHGGYAEIMIKRKHYRIHRLVMNAPDDMIVDHINHDGLDNRKSNLRVVTRSQNQQNRKGAAGHNKHSKIRGISWENALTNGSVGYIQIIKRTM